VPGDRDDGVGQVDVTHVVVSRTWASDPNS
jgi:hypothetical protein